MKQNCTTLITNVLYSFCVLMMCCVASIAYAQTPVAPADSMPAPMEGVCFAKSVTPNKYEIYEEQELIAPSTVKEQFIPAEYDTIRQAILIRQSYEKMVTHEAEFDTIMVEMRVKDNAKVIEEKYKTIFNVEKKPSTPPPANSSEKGDGEWVMVRDPNCKAPDPKDCETLQWIEKKPEFNITTKEVFVQADWADTVQQGETIRVPKVVQVKSARVERIFVPAEYKTVEKIVLRRHARKIMVEIPAKYKTVKKKKLIEKGGKAIWVEVICPASLNEIVISQVQLALKGRKYYKGTISGIFDDETLRALENFQNENALPVGRLDKSTIEALGFNYVIFKQPLEN